jgi:hypothetical protein
VIEEPPLHPYHFTAYQNQEMPPMQGTIDRRFLLLPLKADQSSDNHPDPLREWTRDGVTTPPGWYHVVAYTDTGTALTLLRERINDADATIVLCRGVYWHVSPEYVREIARQLREGERQAFAWSTSSNRFVPYPVAYTRITACDHDGVWHDEDPVPSSTSTRRE